MHEPRVVDGRDHQQVGRRVETGGAREVGRRAGPVDRRRVLALDRASREVTQPVRTEGDGPAVVVAAHDHPDPRVRREPRHQVGPALDEAREPQRLVGAGDPHAGEVPGRRDDELVLGGGTGLLVAPRRTVARGAPALGPDGVAAPGRAGQRAQRLGDLVPLLAALTARLGRRDVAPQAPALVVGSAARFGCRARQPAHERLEGQPVRLREGLAERLAVVGEHDDVVGPRGLPAELLEQPDDAVEALERAQRLGPQRARVVGDLVVVDEVHEDHGRPLHHLLGDERRVEVAQQHVGDRAQGRVGAQARDARLDAPRRLLPALVQLLDELADREQQGPYEHEGTRAELDEGRARPEPPPRAADDEQARRRAAAEHRGDRRAAPGEQPGARLHETLLEERGVARVVGHEEPAQLAVPPAERGDAVRGAVQQPGLGGGRRRRHLRPPRLEPVRAGAQPPRERRREPGLDGVLERPLGEPVELDDQHAPLATGHGRRPPARALRRTRAASGPAAGPTAQVAQDVVVVPQAQQPAAHGHHDGGDHEHRDDVGAVAQVHARDVHEGRPRDQDLRREPEQERRERPEPGREHPQRRAHDRVADGHGERDDEHGPRRGDRHARHDQERDREPRGRRDERPHRLAQVRDARGTVLRGSRRLGGHQRAGGAGRRRSEPQRRSSGTSIASHRACQTTRGSTPSSRAWTAVRESSSVRTWTPASVRP
ncbi:hypothetical protein GCM10025864_41920 [Luteimicrobium album]|uniref:Uncharacterized protein n=1 Tax=Luteimicrobium album TaxID=1054550 RepID=A0ABQ6I8E4_9MICO|nr:hypothetical protein GCM10025864_41920 [Luteimicrobium album]